MVDIYSGPERRRSPRVRAEFVVIYKVDKPIEIRVRIGNKDVNALMLDLSGVGMAILTNCDIPVSTLLLIRFTLINHYAEKSNRIRSMEIVGEVRNNILLEANEHRLGIYFAKISEADRQAIEDFIKMALNR